MEFSSSSDDEELLRELSGAYRAQLRADRGVVGARREQLSARPGEPEAKPRKGTIYIPHRNIYCHIWEAKNSPGKFFGDPRLKIHQRPAVFPGDVMLTKDGGTDGVVSLADAASTGFYIFKGLRTDTPLETAVASPPPKRCWAPTTSLFLADGSFDASPCFRHSGPWRESFYYAQNSTFLQGRLEDRTRAWPLHFRDFVKYDPYEGKWRVFFVDKGELWHCTGNLSGNQGWDLFLEITAPLLPDERVTTVEPLTSDCKKIVYVTTEKFFWTSTTDECTSCKILGSFPNGISCCAPRPVAFPDVTANSFYVCSGKNLSLYSFNASEFERKNLRHFRSTLISSVAGVGTGSGQSSVVVTGMRNGTIQLSAEVGKSWPPFDVKKRHSDVVTAIYPTARDFNFVSVSERGSAKLWDIRFFSESSVFDIVDSTTHSQRCATASTEGILAHCSQERGISFYSTVTGEKLHSVESACKRQICTTTNAVLKNTACSSELLLLSRDFTDHYILQKV